jgi:hypothetical protein
MIQFNGVPEVVMNTRTEEDGRKYHMIDGFLIRDNTLYQIVKVYQANTAGKHEIEYLYDKFKNNALVIKEIAFTIEMQDRATEVLNKRVKTNESKEVCYDCHNLTGAVTDYFEDKEILRNKHGDPEFTGNIVKKYFIKFDSPTERGLKGLWLEEKHFDFI